MREVSFPLSSPIESASEVRLNWESPKVKVGYISCSPHSMYYRMAVEKLLLTLGEGPNGFPRLFMHAKTVLFQASH